MYSTNMDFDASHRQGRRSFTAQVMSRSQSHSITAHMKSQSNSGFCTMSMPSIQPTNRVGITARGEALATGASQFERKESLVHQLAALLLQYGRGALHGDAEVFDEMRTIEEFDAQRTTHDLQMRQAGRRAEDAWRAKNYGEVVDALAPIEEHLTPSDMMRFDYAKRHCTNER
jgi:hypothetical protein